MDDVEPFPSRDFYAGDDGDHVGSGSHDGYFFVDEGVEGCIFDLFFDLGWQQVPIEPIRILNISLITFKFASLPMTVSAAVFMN